MLPAIANYFGGKTHLRSMILPHLNDGQAMYVEPYCGSANILLAKPPHPIEVINDLNGDIVNFFRVLQNRRLFRHFAHRVRWTPYASDEFVEAIMCLNLEWDGKLSVERAWAFFVQGTMGYSGRGESQGNWRRSMLETGDGGAVISHWRMRVKMLEAWRDRLLRVQVDHRPALEVMQYWDAPTTTFYLDPPYVFDTRIDLDAYSHEMTDTDHRTMVEALLTVEGRVILSGYPHPLYAPLERAGWARYDKEILTSMTNSRVGGRETRIESLWINREVAPSLFEPELQEARGAAVLLAPIEAPGPEPERPQEPPRPVPVPVPAAPRSFGLLDLGEPDPEATVPVPSALVPPEPVVVEAPPPTLFEAETESGSGGEGVSFPSVNDAERTPEPPKPTSLLEVLGGYERPAPTWTPQEPPSLDGIDEIILNFETTGLHWRKGDKPIGVTVGTLDGQLMRFLPWGFRGQNLDEAAVKRWLRTIRGKHILNAHINFDMHMSRVGGVDLIEQGNTFSDIQHYAAHLDDHRKRFNLDTLCDDFLGGVAVPRVDESMMTFYEAQDVAARAVYQVQAVAMLRDEFWMELDKQDLQKVRQLEDEVIPVVNEMEKHAAPIDRALLAEFTTQAAQEYEQLLQQISTDAGFSFNDTPESWEQLFAVCGIKVETLKSGKSTFKDEILSSIDHPTIKLGRYAAQLDSLRSKIFKPYNELVGEDGLLHFGLQQLRSDDGGTVCLAGGELVLTDRGYLPVERVQAGDEVISHTGKPRHVLSTVVNGIQPIVKVTLSNGLVLRTTPNHPYRVEDGWVDAGQLKLGDPVAVHSSPEEWKAIEDWADFEISSWGRVFNRKTKRFVTQWPKGVWGHLRVTLRRHGEQTRGKDLKDVAVHRLVAAAFIESNEKEIRHLNGIAWDNTVENLKYGSIEENRSDAILHGTSSKQSGHQAKLTPEAVAFIRSQAVATRSGGYTNEHLSKMFGVHERLIRAVRSGDRWPDREIGEKIVKFTTATVVSVEWGPQEMTYGLVVEEDHSHVTGGIVTHNTGRFSADYIQQVPNHDNHFAVFGDKYYPRRLYVPGQGLFFSADADQIEYRIFSHFAKNKHVIQAYKDNPDTNFHKLIFAMVSPYKSDLSYTATKTLNYSTMYGAQLLKVSRQLGFITEAIEEEIREQQGQWNDPRLAPAREIMQIYEREIPEIKALQQLAMHLALPDCTDRCKKGDALHQKYPHRGFVTSLMGRRSRFTSAHKIHSALNKVIQPSAADLMKLKLVEVWKRRKEWGITLRMTVHDELTADVPDVEIAARILAQLNEQAIPLLVPIRWSGGTGRTWAEAK